MGQPEAIYQLSTTIAVINKSTTVMKPVQTNLLQKIFRILMGSAMVYASIAHFTFARVEFQAQVPNWIPMSKDLVVILSGVVELTLGLGMVFWKKQRIKVGIALAIFYLLIFPGNIAQYVNHTNSLGMNTDKARLIRLFFQPLLIWLALWSTGANAWIRHSIFSQRNA
jgi:uncharacterized membrane protein